jgi:hypothetical protein
LRTVRLAWAHPAQESCDAVLIPPEM